MSWGRGQPGPGSGSEVTPGSSSAPPPLERIIKCFFDIFFVVFVFLYSDLFIK